jgi:hypothetical protein
MTTPHRTPDFIVIGAQKSASTFIQNALGEHPDIYTPKGETSYFESPDYENVKTPPWDDLFKGKTERLVGIKRPQYIGKSEVPARISADLPDTKLIAVLRNPIDRLIAAYFHQVKYGTLPPIPFEKGMPEILRGDATYHSYPRSKELLEFGLYAKHLSGYHTQIAKQSLLILFHEDIVASPQTAIHEVYHFLGVTTDFIPGNLSKRPQKVIYSIPRLKLLTQRNRFLYHYNKDKTRLWINNMTWLEWLSVAAITGIDRTIMRHIFKDKKPILTSELHAKLLEFYEDDIRKLADITGRDLSHWLAYPAN